MLRAAWAGDPGARFVTLHGAVLLVVLWLGLAALATAGAGSPPLLAAAAMVCLLVLRRRPLTSVPNVVWNLVGAAMLVGSGLAWWVWHVHPLSLLVTLTILFQTYRLAARRDSRGTLLNLLLAFSQLMLASILTIRLSFALTVVAFSVAGIAALLLVRLADTSEQAWVERAAGGRAGDDLRDGPLPLAAYADAWALLRWPYLAHLATMTALLLLATVGLFLLIPRLHIGLAGGLADTVAVSGFSEQVRLGSLGRIQLRDDPVMRVEVHDLEGQPVTEPLYFHGLALDTFDGHGWRLGDPRRSDLTNRWYGRPDDPPAPATTTMTQRYVLEPMDSRVLFMVKRPLALDVPLHHIEAASTEGFYFPAGANRPVYTVHSDPTEPSAAILRTAGVDYPIDIRATYLQLPETTARVADLGRRWVGMGATPYDSALVVQQQLRDGYTYSLDQPSAAADDPVDHFLFESQEGHCEYYATAMVVLLRSQGIPSRVVNGFYGGEYNPVGDYVLVRQRDAHSWVEVYFPGSGWQRFDPTPAVDSGARTARLRLSARLTLWADVASKSWREMVLDYDQNTQLKGLNRLGNRLAGGGLITVPQQPRPRLQRSARGAAGGVIVGALVLLALALATAALRARGDPHARLDDVPRGPSRRFVRLTRRALGRLDDRLGPPGRPPAGRPTAGWPAAHLPRTALETAHQADALHPDLGAADVVRRYHAVRFGGHAADDDDVSAARALLRAAGRLRRARSHGRDAG